MSVSSLLVAGLITYLAVVLLSKYQSFTLSLAGIAGLIVAIGITADSFVVFFERLRDEVGRAERCAPRSSAAGRGPGARSWSRTRSRSWPPLLLYIFAVGDVQGFAFTLGLTTLIDMVVVFLFTKPMVTLLARTKFFGQGHKWSGLDPARLGARPRGAGGALVAPAATGRAAAPGPGPGDHADHLEGGIDVAAAATSAAGCTAARSRSTSSAGRSSGTSISGVILVIASLALAVRGLNFSVDFKGGSSLQFEAPQRHHQPGRAAVGRRRRGRRHRRSRSGRSAAASVGRSRPGR